LTDIFISYSRADRSRVSKLAGSLESAGYKIWWDKHLPAGVEFSRETNSRLTEAKAVLVAWSQASVGSMWVADEATVGRTKKILIPVCIDLVEPPLGFRQIQTIDLKKWDGDAAATEFRELCSSLDRILGVKAEPAAPADGEHLRIAEFIKSRRNSAFIILGAVMIATVTTIIFQSLSRPANSARKEGAPVALNLEGATKQALDAIGASERSEDRAAYRSFTAGDQRGALDILEKLAADLEKSGQVDAAAEAYTRAGAVAILVDQGRGLVDRRKAMKLNPESMTVYLGLFFDTFLLQGYDAAMRLAVEMDADPTLSRQMRGFIRATMAIIEADGAFDYVKAEKKIAEIRAIRNGDNDPVLLASEYWASSNIEWKRDNLNLAMVQIKRASQLSSELPPDFPQLFDVMEARINYDLGDWRAAFERGANALSDRQRAGAFLPMPLLSTVCLSGLYLGKVEEAASYCKAMIGQRSINGDALNRIYAAMLFAAQGEISAAEVEINAASALANQPSEAVKAFLIEANAYIFGMSHDIDKAQSATLELSKLYSTAPSLTSSRRSHQAHIFRRLGQWSLEADARQRACNPLATARSLYDELGAVAGAMAVDELVAAAGCDPA